MNSGRGWMVIAFGLVLGAMLGGGLLLHRSGTSVWPFGADTTGITPTDSILEPSTTLDSAAIGQEDPVGDTTDDLTTHRTNAIVRATQKVAPAVVSINVIQQQATRNASMEFMERLGFLPRQRYARPVQNMGSGVIVSADGLIVTNWHVVQGAAQVVVTLSDGRQFEARPVDQATRYDLAVLKIDCDDLPVAAIARDDDLTIGEWAIAIGSPFGYLLADTQPTVTVGVISAVNRDIKRAEENGREYLGMIQTDAAINPGNSGGPLVNTNGEVVGINTFIFSGGSGGSVGIGFAVPAARVRLVLEEIRTYGHVRETHLGIRLMTISPAVAQFLKLTDPVGLVVYSIERESPAWKAGLRPDDVIREIGGQRLTSTDVVARLFYDSEVGDRVPYRAERAGESFTGEIVVEEY